MKSIEELPSTEEDNEEIEISLVHLQIKRRNKMNKDLERLQNELLTVDILSKKGRNFNH